MTLPAHSSRSFQVAVTVLGSATYNLSQWGLLVILARFADSEVVGRFSYILALTAPIFLLASLSLRQVFVTDNHAGSSFKSYYLLRKISLILAILLSLILSYAFTNIDVMLVALITAKSIDQLADLLLAPVQATGRIAMIGLQQGINGLATLLLTFGLLLAGFTAEIAIAVSVLGSLLALLFTLPSHKRSLDLLRDTSGMPKVHTPKSPWRILRASLPLGLAASLGSLAQSVPRLTLEKETSLEVLGVFSATAYLFIAGNTIVAGLAQYELPKAVQLAKSEPEKLRTHILKLAWVWATLSVVALPIVYFTYPHIIVFLYGEEYNSLNVALILTASWGFGAMSWMLEIGILARKRFGFQLKAALGNLAIITILSLTLIPLLGQVGAAFALLGASCFLFFTRLYYLLESTNRLVT